MRIILITTLTALALAGIVVSCSAGSTPTELATATLPPSPTLTTRAPAASATPYPTRIPTPTPPGYPLTVTVRAGWPLTGTAEAALPPVSLTATATARYSLTATARPTPFLLIPSPVVLRVPTVEFIVPTFTIAVPTIVVPTISTALETFDSGALEITVADLWFDSGALETTVANLLTVTAMPDHDYDLDAILATATARRTATPESVTIEATASVRVAEPTVVTSDRRCLAGIEPLAVDIWQTLDDARYLSQTFFEAWGADEGTWGGENPEVDEFVEGMLSDLVDAFADGQEDAWLLAVQGLNVKIAGMWRDLGEGQPEPVAKLLVSIADAHPLLVNCEFGDDECVTRQTITDAKAMAAAFLDLAAAGEDCLGFAPLSERLRNLADIRLSLAFELTEQLAAIEPTVGRAQ